MKVLVTDVDQRYSLVSKSITNYLVLQLPSGRKIRALADDADTQAVLTESSAARSTLEPAVQYTNDFRGWSEIEYQGPEDYGSDDPFKLAAVPLDSSPQLTPVEGSVKWDEPEPTKHIASGMVEWEKLPDTQLPPQMKHILRVSRVSPTISVEDLDKLKLEILQRLDSQPKAGKVEWDTGPRRQLSSAGRRTVPMDEAGNPIPPGGIIEADPGEGPDEDDDGVSQA